MKFPFEIGETVKIRRVVQGSPDEWVVSEVIGFFPSGKNKTPNAILYKYDETTRGMAWEYFSNCYKLTKLDKALS